MFTPRTKNVAPKAVFKTVREERMAQYARIQHPFLVVLFCLVAMPVALGGNAKYNYPFHTVMLATHSKPGSGADLFLRNLGAALHRQMGVNFVVEYWPGGSGAKAMAKLTQAPADGSVFYATDPTDITTSLVSHPQITFRDIDYVTNVFFDPVIFFTLAKNPLSSMKEAITWSKAHPGKAKWGVKSPGSFEREITEQLNADAAAHAIIIPHDSGTEMMLDVLNGTVDLGVGNLDETLPYIKSGTLKVIGTYSPQRLAQLPDVPTITELGIRTEIIRKFRGLGAPKGVPRAEVEQIEQAIQAALNDRLYQKQYEAAALIPGYMGQKKYRAFIADFAQRQERFFRAFGITTK
jgi:putative tricarboxylic transport membrane protein